jgi:D-lactate dehydrogenase
MPTLCPVQFTRDTKVQYALWKLRKGMYPAVAAVRAKGEAAILEDIAVPVVKLGPAILDLQKLFAKHHYANGIIFGHAKDGNLHFVITQSMDGQEDIQKYARFIDDMVDLVVRKYDGALKAEHGTGRNMAPFVETEWGSEALALMKKLKSLLDPEGILNPDVILSAQLAIHTKNLKDLPVVEDIVDKCIECGACEPRCPSRDFTLSPRQRIVVRRAAARLQRDGHVETANELHREYQYSGLATCATDGLCAVDCPVNINTGDLVKQLRHQQTRRWDTWLARQAAQHFGIAERAVTLALRLGMTANRLFSKRAMSALTGGLARIVPQFPRWHDSLSTESLPRSGCSLAQAEYIYLPACMSRMMGGTAKQLLGVCERASIRIQLPPSLAGLCCGQAFSSKGYTDVAVDKQAEWIDRAWELSDHGRLAIVMDLGSCSAFLQMGLAGLNEESRRRLRQLRILDTIEFANDVVLPKLTLRRRLAKIALHSVCANQKTRWDEKLLNLAGVCAEQVIVPHAGKCCGMGGDRGFAIPELAMSATADVRSAMNATGCTHGYTSARSCAISLATSTGCQWESIFHLLDEVSK